MACLTGKFSCVGFEPPPPKPNGNGNGSASAAPEGTAVIPVPTIVYSMLYFWFLDILTWIDLRNFPQVMKKPDTVRKGRFRRRSLSQGDLSSLLPDFPLEEVAPEPQPEGGSFHKQFPVRIRVRNGVSGFDWNFLVQRPC
jgi:hypothetical protein